jgi:hypothetical protein
VKLYGYILKFSGYILKLDGAEVNIESAKFTQVSFGGMVNFDNKKMVANPLDPEPLLWNIYLKIIAIRHWSLPIKWNISM